ncbi:MAG TPA: DUF4384 domain-containing protein [Gemmatimonadales bacterium]
MSATVLLALTSLLGAPEAVPGVLAPADPPVKIWLNPSRGFERGDRVRIDARAELDGYLLVLHADPTGRIRVLFPLDPFEDSFVRGERKFELRGRGDRQAFTIYESDGVGTVLAVWSPDPFNFAGFARGDHWDYTLASTWDAGGEQETYLVGLAQRVVTSPQFDYDVVQYDVGAPVAYGGARSYRFGYYHGSYYDRFGFSIGWGSPYGYWAYRPASYWYGYYDPFYYGGWYDPWWGSYSPYGSYCVGWCSWRSYYYSSYWRYPRAVAYNNYYYGRSVPSTRFGAGAYTFKLNGQPRLVAEPRQRAPLASAVGRRLAAEPSGVVTARRTETAQPARRVLGDRTVRPAIGGGTPVQRGVEQPRRVETRDRATVTTGRTPERAGPGRVTARDRAVVPDQAKPEPRRVDSRDRAATTERAPERTARPVPEPRRVERQGTEGPRVESQRPQPQGRAPSREAEPQRRPAAREQPRTEAQPRLEPRRAPTRAPERSAQPSRGSGPSVRSAPPPRSSGSSGRSAGSSAPPRSSTPARSSGGSSSGGRRRG